MSLWLILGHGEEKQRFTRSGNLYGNLTSGLVFYPIRG